MTPEQPDPKDYLGTKVFAEFTTPEQPKEDIEKYLETINSIIKDIEEKSKEYYPDKPPKKYKLIELSDTEPIDHNDIRKSYEHWIKGKFGKNDWYNMTIENVIEWFAYFIQPLQIDRDEYKALFESAIKKGQELIEENASLQNQNTLLQEDNLSLSKALSDLITKMKVGE